MSAPRFFINFDVATSTQLFKGKMWDCRTKKLKAKMPQVPKDATDEERWKILTATAQEIANEMVPTIYRLIDEFDIEDEIRFYGKCIHAGHHGVYTLKEVKLKFPEEFEDELEQ